jgi:hypothetical protein
MNLKKSISLIVLFTASLFLSSCVDIPNNIAPPRYDVTLNFPLRDTTFTIDDAIKDDSTITVSKDPNTLGLLSYSQTKNISTFKVEDNLTINGFSTHFSKVIGSVKINNVTPIGLGIRVEDWTSNVHSGSYMIFPENVGDLNIPFKKIKQFESVTLDAGSLKVKMVNRLPVEIKLEGIKIKNAVSGTIVVNKPATEVIDLQPLDSAEVTFDLGGKTIEDSLMYVGRIYTPGSHGQKVQIPADAGTRITAYFSNLEISQVSAVLPQQDPFTKEGTVAFDDSTYLTKAVFDEGSFKITFDNHLDLDIKLDLEIKNLKKADGSIFTESVTLKRKENDKVISVPSISGWAIESENADSATNQLSYKATVTAFSSNDPRVLSKDDSISIQIDFNKTTLRSVEGKIKPTNFNISESKFDLDMGDIKNKLSFENINFNDPIIKLVLYSSAEMNFELNSTLSASNGTQTKTMNLKNVIISSPGTNVIDLRDYGLKDSLNGFTKSLPEHFVFSGKAIVNPEYKIGKVTKDDSISGNVNIEIPLDIGIAGGSFKDTVKVKGDRDTSDIDINFVDLTLETTNAIPFNLIFRGEFLDTLNNPLFSLPPEGNSADSLVIPAPTVSTDGYVTAPGVNKQVIRISGTEAKRFMRNGKVAMEFKLFTPPPDRNTPVKFRNTDYISVKAYATAGYRVNN